MPASARLTVPAEAPANRARSLSVRTTGRPLVVWFALIGGHSMQPSRRNSRVGPSFGIYARLRSPSFPPAYYLLTERSPIPPLVTGDANWPRSQNGRSKRSILTKRTTLCGTASSLASVFACSHLLRLPDPKTGAKVVHLGEPAIAVLNAIYAKPLTQRSRGKLGTRGLGAGRRRAARSDKQC